MVTLGLDQSPPMQVLKTIQSDLSDSRELTTSARVL